MTRHAALTDGASLQNAMRRGDVAPSAAGVTENGMTVYESAGDKSPGTTEQTAREATLSWAEQQSRIQARATRAFVSIHQTHLSYYDR